MKKIILTVAILGTVLSTKADTLIKYNTGNERHIIVYKSCDGVYWEVHKLVKVKPNQEIQLRLKEIKGYTFKVEKHICKL